MQELHPARHARTQVPTNNATDRQGWSDLTASRHRDAATSGEAATIFIVDDDAAIRETMRDVLEDHGYTVECFADGPAFLRAFPAGGHGCLLIDALMPGMSGIMLLEELKASGIALPAVMMSGDPRFHIGVQAMKAGAVDFIEKPFKSSLLLATVKTALEQAEAAANSADFFKSATQRIRGLTKRQHEILDLVVAGHPSKNIAADLHISQRTVDNHRAAITRKTRSKSLPMLIQTALCANCSIARSRQEPDHACPSRRSGEGDM